MSPKMNKAEMNPVEINTEVNSEMKIKLIKTDKEIIGETSCR